MAVGYIYQIKNILNNKIYIGSTNNYKKRVKEHYGLLIKNKHFSKKLQRSWNKYGESNFVFDLLEECDITTFRNREQELLQEMKPYFNNTYNVIAGSGYILSEKACAGIRTASRKRWNDRSEEGKQIERQRLSSLRKGIPISEDHRTKLHNGLMEKKPWIKSLEKRIAVLKISNYEKKRKEVIQYSKTGEKLNEFKSIREAGESLGLTSTQYSSITKVCKEQEGRTQAYGFIWKYKNQQS